MGIKALIFLLSISIGYPQAIYRMRMNVREVSFGVTRCEYLTVVWGIKEDTLCLMFDDKAICLYPTNKNAKIDPTKRILLKDQAILRSRGEERHFILQDFRNEVYHVRIIINDIGVLMIIINIKYGHPSYMLGFNCSECL